MSANINVAGNLKRLRKQREITQEDLADFIGVTFQAVSKWERGDGFPDITFLPALANFFDVTVDEILGMDEMKNESHLDGVMEQLRQNEAAGKVEENISMLREEIKLFPNNFSLLHKLSHYLTYSGERINDIDAVKKNSAEALEINKKILAFCTDSGIRSRAHAEICYNYSCLGEHEKAIEQARKLPGLWDTQNYVLSGFLKGDEYIKAVQESLLQYVAMIHSELEDLSGVKNPEFELRWTNKERIEILKKSIKFYEALCEDGDYYFNCLYLSDTHRFIAELYLDEGNIEEALAFLAKAVSLAVSFDTLSEKAAYTSLLLNGLVFDRNAARKNIEGSCSSYMLNKLDREIYDAVRCDKRFSGFTEELRRYA